MSPTDGGNQTVRLEDELSKSYLDYAMSVIIGRALPDVRDGLKPVHRRVLYAQEQQGNRFNAGFKKSARIVGDVIGKYHPHGDQAVYDALVRMAQDFSLRYPLVDGQGNFGSSRRRPGRRRMRYTEVQHEPPSPSEMHRRPGKRDGGVRPQLRRVVRTMPTGAARARTRTCSSTALSGIAVGMATNIPPHNIERG